MFGVKVAVAEAACPEDAAVRSSAPHLSAAALSIAQVPVKLACGLSTIKSATGEMKLATMTKFVVSVTANGLFVPVASPDQPPNGNDDVEVAVSVTSVFGV